MAKELIVRLSVPVPTLPITPHPGLIFNRWLPTGEEDALVFNEGEFEVKFWFDMSCLDEGFRGMFAHDELHKWLNVTVSKVFIDVTVKDVPDDLADYVFATSERTDLSNQEMHKAFENLNVRVIRVAIKYFNRLASFFRNEKGQFWLDGYTYLYDNYLMDARNKITFHNMFDAKVKLKAEGSGLVKWNPPYTGILMATSGLDSKYVRREEWPEVYDFLLSSRRPALILELLASSETLANSGYGRSAIVEAVAALEAAVENFSESPKWGEVLRAEVKHRIDTNAFSAQVRHLGFSATLRYLLPLLFSEEDLPAELLHKCQRAVEIRNTVAHKGQRNLDKRELLVTIHAIRQVCSILKRFSG